MQNQSSQESIASLSAAPPPGDGTAMPAQGAGCAHCSLPIPTGRSGSEFCCPGCEFVYQTLKHSGLESFYALREAGGGAKFKPERAGQKRFEHFNDPLFLKDFLRPAVTGSAEGAAQIAFHLEGVHCAACVWLVERLPRVRPGVLSARLDFSRAVVNLQFDPQSVLVSEIAAALDSLGYYPSPVREDEREHFERKSDRSLMLQIGVAGLSAGNTMMLAFSLYQAMFTGIEPEYDALHKWSCFALTLPAVLYSALPFYKTALGALRAFRLHLDLPISIGILIGFVASTWNTIVGTGHVYFDSVSMLIFLLLLGRWAQQTAVRKASAAMRYQPSFLPQQARLWDGVEAREIYVRALKVGAQIQVLAGEIIPADGRVIVGASALDRAILTGESEPETVRVGDNVFAGTTNLSSPLVLEVEALGEQTRVGRLLVAVRESLSNRTPFAELTDRISGWFVGAVMLLSAFTFYWCLPLGVEVALERVVALLVITCPCALGLAAPIAMSVAVSRAAQAGIVIREPEAIERLNAVRTIYFDKTGTLTAGRAEVQLAFLGSELRPESFPPTTSSGELKEILAMLRALELGFEHPYARAICAALGPEFDDALTTAALSRRQIVGSGVEARDASGREWRLGSLRWALSLAPLNSAAAAAVCEIRKRGLSPLLLMRDGQVLAALGLGDALRSGAQKLLADVRRFSRTFLLSGDERSATQATGAALGFAAEEVLAEKSPEAKMEIVAESERSARTAMVGDGVNDAGALAAAGVGIGVRGGVEACLAVARVFVGSRELAALSEVFGGARRTMNVIKLNLWISLIYNVLGVWAAVSGLVNPLVAAIVMPLSSLSVVLTSSLLSSYRAEAEWK